MRELELIYEKRYLLDSRERERERERVSLVFRQRKNYMY